MTAADFSSHQPSGFPLGWGAFLMGKGRARFRLWAPAENKLALRLGGRDHPMEERAGGWFELDLEGVAAGTAYAFVLADGSVVPDPASRAQESDVHGSSILVDSTAYRWRHAGWTGRPWEETVLYELHIGTFTPEGTFSAAAEKLQHLVDVGVTAIELMPLAQFAGSRGWGYDGVLPYAPHNAYGSPDELKELIDRAHGLGLMVLLDVVYNHFGPEGNYLARYAPGFFDPDRHTPWGAGIAYEKPAVRRFFIDNALYWLDEFRLDGLRLDAVDHIVDRRSSPELLVELAQVVRSHIADRFVHLCTEDNRNITALHERGESGSVPLHTGEWNDDFHNVAHVILTGESEGYYADFTENKWQKLARALAEGFVYQGEPSAHAGGKARGEPSGHLPPAAFIDFLQNHDQIGNRAFGERLVSLAPKERLRPFMAMLLLSPHIPLLFMGDEWGETHPFLFFTDFHDELADIVRKGRRKEFEGFAAFQGEDATRAIPDPNARSTLEASKLDWTGPASDNGRDWLSLIRGLLSVRREHIVPALAGTGADSGRIIHVEEGALAIDWRLRGGLLQMRANLSDVPVALPAASGAIIYRDGADEESVRGGTLLPARSIAVALADAEPQHTAEIPIDPQTMLSR